MKLLLNTVILTFFAMVGINIANATEVTYGSHMHLCTLIPNATITIVDDVARSTINNHSGEVVIEPNSCMQATLPDADADATTATVVFGGRSFTDSNYPINIYVTKNQQNSWVLSTVHGDSDAHIKSNSDTEHRAIKNMVLQENNDFVIYDNGSDVIWNSGFTSDWDSGEATLNLQITSYYDNYYIVELYITRPTNFILPAVPVKITTIIQRQIYGWHQLASG